MTFTKDEDKTGISFSRVQQACPAMLSTATIQDWKTLTNMLPRTGDI